MNQNESMRFQQTTTHQMIVSALQEDGCECNPYTKTYDEQATYEGGRGCRLAFTNYNKSIIAYHSILKALTGERRANIRETIPVIDFANIENTSLLYKYLTKDNTNTEIDPTVITAIDVDSSETNPTPMLNYILDEDESIVNRAVMGHPMKAHFYNSFTPVNNDYNLQTAPSTGTFETAYLGIKLRPVVIYGKEQRAIQETSMQTLLVPAETWIYYDPDMSSFDDPETQRDENGTLIANDKTQTSDGSIFIKKETSKDGNYKIILTEEDICMILPPSTYSSASTKILIFKKNQTASSKPGNDVADYDMFIVYASKATPSRTFTEVPFKDSLPSYLVNDFLYDKYTLYVKAEKRYYGPASGLLSGYFCVPELKESSSAGNSEIKRWYFVDETKEAKLKNVDIDIGSKYFEGHILNRGNILDQPLKLTTSDYPSKHDFDILPKDKDGVPYTGKATLIYDKLLEMSEHLFDSIKVPRSRWSDFKLCTLDSITTKLDYANEMLGQKQYLDLTGLSKENLDKQPKLKLSEKMHRPDGEPITLQDIRDFISACKNAIDGETLRIDLIKGKDTSSYSYVVNENSTFFNWGLARKDTEWGGEGNKLTSEFKKIFHCDYTVRYKYKRRKLINALSNLQVKMLTPFDLFVKNDSDNVVLLYPDHPKFMPDELFLISKYDLGLEEYHPVITGMEASPSRGMCSFYNSEAKKIICFKVSEVIPILTDKIKTVSINEPETNSWHSTSSMNISYETVWTETRDEEGNVDGGYYSNIARVKPIGTSCYVYVLAPMEVSLSGATVYDAEDKIVDFREGVNDIALMPMTYPEEYFSLEAKPNPDGSLAYVVKESHRHADLELLKGSYIIPGLPDFSDPEELRTMTKDNLKLDLFADLMGKGVATISNLVIKKGLDYILSTWKLSDSETNPITLTNLPDVLEGLIESEPHLESVVQSKFKVPVAEGDDIIFKEVRAEDFSNFFTLVKEKQDTIRYSFDINNAANSVLTPDDTLESSLTKRFNEIKIESKGTKSERLSLKDLKTAIGNMFGKTASLTRDNCKTLDLYLGNNTKAFLSFGETNRDDVIPSDVIVTSETLGQMIKQTIKNVDSEMRAFDIAEALEPVYKIYFTDASVLDALYMDGASKSKPRPSIDTRKLILDYANYTKNNSLRNLVNQLKNQYGQDKVKRRARFLFWSWNVMRECTMEEFLDDYKLKSNPGLSERPSMSSSMFQKRSALQDQAYSRAFDEVKGPATQAKNSKVTLLSDEAIDSYMFMNDDNFSMVEENSDNYLEKQFSLHMNIPKYASAEKTSIVPSGIIYTFKIGPYLLEQGDISQELLKGIAKYIKQRLEGTGKNAYYVRYVHGDKELTGRENSLYYKRYQQLNNRMNTLKGSLAKAGNYFTLMNSIEDEARINSGFADSYKEFMEVLPFVGIEPLIFLKEQQATGTTLPMQSKFCYEKELDFIRKNINNQCVLTCNSCNVKNSCPFYNEEEIIKTTATSAKTIDLWVKDNMLDLLVYDNSEDETLKSPNVTYTAPDGTVESLDVDYLKNIHKPFSDICKKVKSMEKQDEIIYQSRDLEAIRQEFMRTFPNFAKECKGGLGWLLGARYGTVAKYHAVPSIEAQLGSEKPPEYTYMHDALFVFDDKSDIVYKDSSTLYDVSLELGEGNDKHVYTGKTRIKIPIGLKAFARCQPQDEVYLVSDDTTDSEGNPIVPVIYMNTVANLRYTFDLTENNESEIQSQDDPNIYPKDVAQWCINYAKGSCYKDPIGSSTKHINADHDQYWMPKIKKKTKDGWIEANGRPRYNANYQEVLTSSSEIDPYLLAIGRPPVASYINFKRKVMFSMDSILWVKESSDLVDASSVDLDVAFHNAVEKQKSVLPSMKTRLRLAIVRQPAK